ncbi:hypothetical protein [Candidatus Nitrospira salsa]
MFTQDLWARSLMLAGIPLLALPLIAQAGSSRDHSDRGGSQSSYSQEKEKVVRGEFMRKDGDQITIRSRDGRKTSFRINNQTNQLCPNSSSSQSGQSSQGSSMSQGSPMSSSGSSGQSSSEDSEKQGFTFGDCNFQNGDSIKAKINQEGNATYVRSMGYRGEDDRFEAGRSGEDYFVLPAGQLGGLDISDKDAKYTVKTKNGQEVGHIYRLVNNNQGEPSYAIVRKTDGQLISVPWQAMEGQGNKTFKLNVSKTQLGDLPILEEGDDTAQHVEQHWNLNEDFYEDREQAYRATLSPGDRGESRDRRGQESAYNYDDQRAYRGWFAGQDRIQDKHMNQPERYRGTAREFRQRSWSDRYSPQGRTNQSRDRRDRGQGSESAYKYEDQEAFKGHHAGQDRIRDRHMNQPERYRSSDRDSRDRYSDESRNQRSQRSMYSQSRDRNDDDSGNTYERYRERRSSDDDRSYDSRPSRYRP